MNTRNQKETPAHSSAFHEDQLPLFDAYGTGELDGDEQVQVEQNLQHCQECQHLFAEVTHLRQRLETLSETETSVVAAHTRLHLQPILQPIIARIEQGEDDRNHLRAERTKQAPIFSRQLSAHSPALSTQPQTKTTYLQLGAAVGCVILLAGLIITLLNILPSSGKGSVSVPGIVAWVAQPPMLVQNSAGVFALKEMEIITAKEFHFYYAFHSSRQVSIYATAISSLKTGQHPVSLHTTIWPLGTIDGISVGVIRVQYLDRTDQTITLNITSQQARGISWKFTPFKQLHPEPHPEGGGYYGFPVDQHLFPAIIWSGPRTGPAGPSQNSTISLFQNPAGTHYIFLQVDYSGKIALITKAQCIQLVTKPNCQ